MVAVGRKAPAVADELGVTDDTVRKWAQGAHAPEPATVFALEHLLGVVPGGLSRYLGYLPVDAPVVTSAIEQDPDLSAHDRYVLHATYEAMLRA